jgi:hypothetical protein
MRPLPWPRAKAAANQRCATMVLGGIVAGVHTEVFYELTAHWQMVLFRDVPCVCLGALTGAQVSPDSADIESNRSGCSQSGIQSIASIADPTTTYPCV